MFDITRKIDETFYIVGAIEMEICILDIHGDQAKLCLKIPKDSHISNKKMPDKKRR